MEKTKEEFVQFIRHAMLDRNSNEFIELYQFLLGCFVRADANMDGQVSADEFDALIDSAAFLPRKHGFAPQNEQIYSSDAARKEARKKVFEKMDSNKDGHITFEEWLVFSLDHIQAKMGTLKKDIMAGADHTKEEFIAFIKKAMDPKTSENRELFFFLLKCFVDADKDRDGAIQPSEFDTMIEIAAAAPRRHGLAPKTNEIYKTEAERVAARKEKFKVMDINNDNNISFDEWLKYAMEHIASKAAAL